MQFTFKNEKQNKTKQILLMLIQIASQNKKSNMFFCFEENKDFTCLLVYSE